MTSRNPRDGFTLTELLVATVIMGIVITSVLGVFATQNRIYVGHERVVEVQEDARLVIELVRTDLRMGGFLLPPIVGVSGRDGGTNGPDAICASDPRVLAEAAVASTVVRFQGSSLLAAVTANQTSVQLVPSSMDVDSDGDDDYAVNAGIILSDGSDTHCARVVGVAGNVVSFAPATPAGFGVGPPAARAAPAVIYEVTAAGLMRNGTLLSSQVEDLQAEYVVDANNNGAIDAGEFPIHDLNASIPSQLRGLRVSVITRTAAEVPNLADSRPPAAGNRVAGAPDGFVRRRFTVRVIPRNLM